MAKVKIHNCKIDDLSGAAWEGAIKHVADLLNKECGTNYTIRDDWQMLEILARISEMSFDVNGDL